MVGAPDRALRIGRPTRIDSNCSAMNEVWVEHDGDIGDGVTVASPVTLSGHVTVGNRAALGATVHQRRVIATGVMPARARASPGTSPHAKTSGVVADTRRRWRPCVTDSHSGFHGDFRC
jgi:acyl-[acyl carrier protein]--UDP-N-acetylglucosamine O-acyltransferase